MPHARKRHECLPRTAGTPARPAPWRPFQNRAGAEQSPSGSRPARCCSATRAISTALAVSAAAARSSEPVDHAPKTSRNRAGWARAQPTYTCSSDRSVVAVATAAPCRVSSPAATAASSASFLVKCLYRALCETPARWSTSRRVTASGPRRRCVRPGRQRRPYSEHRPALRPGRRAAGPPRSRLAPDHPLTGEGR